MNLVDHDLERPVARKVDEFPSYVRWEIPLGRNHYPVRGRSPVNKETDGTSRANRERFKREGEKGDFVKEGRCSAARSTYIGSLESPSQPGSSVRKVSFRPRGL